MTGFPQNVPYVTDASAVSASNANAASRILAQRTESLREQLAQAAYGSQLVLRDQVLAPESQIGHMVYWDAVTSAFKPGLAAVTADNGVIELLPTADVAGCVLARRAGGIGDIGLYGVFRLSPGHIANLCGSGSGMPSPGRYYLSAVEPGRVTQQQPPITVTVVRIWSPPTACEADTLVLIAPQLRDFIADHTHYQFLLTARPAGGHTPPDEGESHVITDSDVTLQGWLPADHASFAGRAPDGAVFGYNLAAHASLQGSWPPLPVTAAELDTWRDDEEVFPTASRVLPSHVTFTRYGIWWMTDCYGQVPWPTLLDTSDVSAPETPACPEPSMSLLLSFLRMRYAASGHVVTSLQPAAGHPLEFVNCDGQPANTGDLFAKISLAALIASETVTGGQVLKTIVNPSLAFGRGWVTEGIRAGSDRVLLSGTQQRHLVPADETTPLVYQGVVTIDVPTDAAARELLPQILKLSDALEREYAGLLYVGFPNGRNSSVLLQFAVPVNGLPDNPNMQLRATLFGRGLDGPWSAMTVTCKRVPRPVANESSDLLVAAVPVTFDVVTPSDSFDGIGTNVPKDSAIEITSAAFSVTAGDSIFITLGRAPAASPVFAADIGLLRVVGLITGA